MLLAHVPQHIAGSVHQVDANSGSAPFRSGSVPYVARTRLAHRGPPREMSIAGPCRSGGELVPARVGSSALWMEPSEGRWVLLVAVRCRDFLWCDTRISRHWHRNERWTRVRRINGELRRHVRPAERGQPHSRRHPLCSCRLSTSDMVPDPFWRVDSLRWVRGRRDISIGCAGWTGSDQRHRRALRSCRLVASVAHRLPGAPGRLSRRTPAVREIRSRTPRDVPVPSRSSAAGIIHAVIRRDDGIGRDLVVSVTGDDSVAEAGEC